MAHSIFPVRWWRFLWMRDSGLADFLRADRALESGRAALPGACRWFHWGGQWRWRSPGPCWAEGGGAGELQLEKTVTGNGVRTVPSSLKMTGEEKWQMHRKINIHFIPYHVSGKPLSESIDCNSKLLKLVKSIKCGRHRLDRGCRTHAFTVCFLSSD